MAFVRWASGSTVVVGLSAVVALSGGARASARQSPPQSVHPIQGVINNYCISCHNEKARVAGLALDGLDASNPASHPEVWERVVEKLRAGSMPPPGRPRPDKVTYRTAANGLEAELDRAWAARPEPGRIGAVHRLNRTEYGNAIRDLFGLDPLSIDITSQLPGDETADGSFDNFADVLSISTSHLERYMSVARQVTRRAAGLAPPNPVIHTFEVPLHATQEDRESEDLPLASRGGIAVRYHFPVDGEYTIVIRLQRNYQDYIKGMGWEQHLDVRLDGKLLKRFAVGGRAQGRAAGASYAGDGGPGFAGAPEWEKYMQIDGDADLKLRLPVAAGSRVVGVSFAREFWMPQGLPQPLQRGRVITNDEVYMGNANLASVQIGGPYSAESLKGKEQPGQGNPRVFLCYPRAASEEKSCATKIFSRLARLAYRRPVNSADLQGLMTFFESGRRDGGSFDAGIQFALERMLVDPDFLLRVYLEPTPSVPSARVYRLSDIELASRLAFFIWSSIPDETLLSLAEKGRLSDPAVLEQQVKRMLADARGVEALVDDFASQWLNLRRITEVVVDPRRYPHYDLTLMAAFKRETELFVGNGIRADRSVIELLSADYTFVNEKLARHYGIPGIYGSRFRRVTLPNRDQRGGLLAHGSLLATTSYPDRTSPVLRGKFLLDNIFGLSVPPPPPGVDTNLPAAAPGAPPPSIRQRLAAHRSNPSCASCHALIDPLGFSLENFDVIGGWRGVDESGRSGRCRRHNRER